MTDEERQQRQADRRDNATRHEVVVLERGRRAVVLATDASDPRYSWTVQRLAARGIAVLPAPDDLGYWLQGQHANIAHAAEHVLAKRRAA
jgi:hypothetical protein